MTELPSQIPPGWYQDPAGAMQFRWWDGLAWTHHVREPQPATTSAIPEAPRVASAVPHVPPVPLPPWVVDESTDPGYVPFAAVNSVTPLAPVIVNTIWVWLIALSPLWAGVVSLLVELSVSGSSFDSSAGDASTGISLAAPVAALAIVVLLFVFAFLDRHALLRSGHPSAASTWWMLLFPPVAYLIARRIRVKRWTGRGAAPGNVFAMFYLVPLVLGALAAILVPLILANS